MVVLFSFKLSTTIRFHDYIFFKVLKSVMYSSVCSCIHTMCVSCAHRGQKRMSYLLELELQMAMNHHMVAGK